MTHLGLVEHLNGKSVEWMEKVSDEQYQVGAQDEEGVSRRGTFSKEHRIGQETENHK